MRVLTDFDGVLTAQEDEAAALGRRHVELVARALGDAALAAALFEETRREARAHPEAFGWISGGAISCYADEDPYAFHNAVAFGLYARAPEDVLARLAAAGLATADDLALRAWHEAERGFRAANASHVMADALASLGELLAAGAEVVIVSNSATERIQALLGGAGFDRFGAARPRIRGDARKFALGAEPADLPAEALHGGRPVRVRRPSYHEILREEAPDLVIGDVFSLDIALPAAMRAAGRLDTDTRIVLKRHAYTPPWALRACAAAGIEIVDAFARVPELLGV